MPIDLQAPCSANASSERRLLDAAAGPAHRRANGEDVGECTSVGTREGDSLRARVCVSDASDAAAVTERVLQQL
jgi:hypothetical protein